jgi:transcriptional regulator with XRE-family HTH domain
MTPAQRFGSNLARTREKRGLSQSQLARKVDVVDNYISRIETGRAEPSFRLILALAKQLEVPPAELFAGIG